MTGDDIIELARYHFGEETANSVSADMALAFLNEALNHVYSDLPASKLKELLTESTVSLISGQGDIVTSWDKVIEVYIDDKPAVRVNRETIYNTGVSDYFSPGVPVFYIDESHIWTVPTDGVAKVVHLAPPSIILSADTDQEITEIHKAYHPAVADLLAFFMYAQEEDIQQASHYKNEYVAKLNNVTQQLEAEDAA